MPPDHPPYIERYGYTWLQHPDGLYYGPLYPREDEPLVFLRARWQDRPCLGTPGGVSVFLENPRGPDEKGDDPPA
jgi:hypothetical protein